MIISKKEAKKLWQMETIDLRYKILKEQARENLTLLDKLRIIFKK